MIFVKKCTCNVPYNEKLISKTDRPMKDYKKIGKIKNMFGFGCILCLLMILISLFVKPTTSHFILSFVSIVCCVLFFITYLFFESEQNSL